jgi:hypothetical protein
MSVSGSLSSRAMVVSLSISQWSAQRLDRSVTEEVTQQKNAAKDAGNFNKHLLPKEALGGINKIVSATRDDFLQRTLPWMNDGSRIMRAEAFMAHSAWFQGQKTKFFEAVEEFLTKYPAYTADAQRRMGDMFDPTDFPLVRDLRARFDMRMRIMPAPSAEDFRVQMSEHQAAAIRSEIEASITSAAEAAVKNVYERIHEVCSRMVERLTAYRPSQGKGDRAEGTFRDSLVLNVRDLCGIMPALNITGSPDLDRLASELEKLGRFDADTLRFSDRARDETKKQAQDILDQIGAFIA